MNAQATISPRPVLTHANAYSLIPCNRPLTEKERRAVFPLLDRYEQELAEAWRAERWGEASRPVDPEVSARMAALRKDAHERAAAANRAKRQERKRAVAAILAQGPMQRADLEGLVDLSGAALKALLRDMVNDGMILMNRAPGAGRNFVYEVAQ